MRACRIDRNQPEIIKEFRRLGWSVKPVHTIKGFADILVSKNNITIVIEIKDGLKSPSQRCLTGPEKDFRDGWQGRYEIVVSINDVKRIDDELREMLQKNVRRDNSNG